MFPRARIMPCNNDQKLEAKTDRRPPPPTRRASAAPWLVILIYRPLSAGRAESLWKGLSGREPRKAETGQGWPVLPAPGAATERGKFSRSENPRWGQAFWLLCRDWQSDSRVRRETKRSAHAVT